MISMPTSAVHSSIIIFTSSNLINASLTDVIYTEFCIFMMHDAYNMQLYSDNIGHHLQKYVFANFSQLQLPIVSSP